MTQNKKIKEYYQIKKDDKISFQNHATFCIGTGRMGLALRHEYCNQLKKVQDEIGFSYIRGHGLFSDDMGIYHTYEEEGIQKEEYNFSYLDKVFDTYMENSLKPFIELGFMPGDLASGDQTVFYWKGNVTPPSDYKKWEDLVIVTIKHLISRYGLEEVISWPFEVWNEPNLAGFWKGADMEEYFKLYEVTSKAVKKCDTRLRVGGPAICGVDDERWLCSFLSFCQKQKAPLDFVTRHAYAVEEADRKGHYDYQKLRDPQFFMDELRESRRIIDSFPEYIGMEMHITEFNTSYTPRCPLHDTNLNGAYIARLLSEMGDVCASYSYWTFGDVFEENGVSFTPFSGCFGLLANGMIPKPTYWTFSFYSQLAEKAVARGEHFVLTKDEQNKYVGIAWNIAEEVSSDFVLNYELEIENGVYLVVTKLVDEETCNPLQDWINMGAPSNPSQKQVIMLQESALPQIRTEQKEIFNQKMELEILLSSNAVCYFEIQKVEKQNDRGYEMSRIRGVRTNAK
ncbi:MAG TPA: xylan 1,4-beta-xylosidase [Lachnospiraceae bacterium]|nr:xylan 1,4-beta-xylosidase [Lachnospiraceae bacterium]